MATESMTSDERLWAAIRLEKPDRVPVVPMVLPEAAARLTGKKLVQVANSNQAAIDAVIKVFDEFGGWDNPFPGIYVPAQFQAANLYPMKIRIPGKDLPEDHMWQLVEEEILQPEDYEKICEMGIDRFYYEDYLWRITDLQPEEVPEIANGFASSMAQFGVECSKRGLRPFFSGTGFHPFFTLSLMRSMIPFTQDLYYNPEPVERALKCMTAELIPKQISLIKESGINMWLFTEERASCYFYPPAIFERFWWPYTLEIVDACWSEGIVTIFHLDQCWDKNLPYFKKLPKGSAILELDSTTDIFLAKEVLGGHLCLHGDVPASLLSLGNPEDVEAYCKRLIDEAGAGGGFILGSGCGVPPNVKPENLRALVETGKRYEFSGK